MITIFVIVWSCAFHYESVRGYFLNPLFDTTLPKVKFLFPPAGWIMFYNVDDHFGHAQVFGVKDKGSQPIDPHDIIPTRFIGFDNIHRGILGNALRRQNRYSFCRYMERKFPYFDNFVFSWVDYPNLSENRHQRKQQIVYQCSPTDRQP